MWYPNSDAGVRRLWGMGGYRTDPPRPTALRGPVEPGPQLHLPWTDFWGKDVEARALELARVWTKDYRDDPLLLGYFAGNDFPWWDENLFWHFLGRPWREKVASAGRLRWVINKTKLLLVELLERHYRKTGRPEQRLGDSSGGGADRILTPRQEADGALEAARSVLSGPQESRQPRRRLGRRPKVIDLFLTKLYDRYWKLISRAIGTPTRIILFSVSDPSTSTCLISFEWLGAGRRHIREHEHPAS